MAVMGDGKFLLEMGGVVLKWGMGKSLYIVGRRL